MSLISSICMFFLSFAPLWSSILFMDIKSIVESSTSVTTEWISIIVIGTLSIISILVLLTSLKTKKRAGIQKFRITEAEEEKTITAEYLLSYILPLFAFDFRKWDHVILFLIYFLTLGYLCIRHNHLSVNIVLELLGYRFYKCRLVNEDEIIVSKSIISKEKLINHKTQIMSIKPLNNEYSLDLMDW